MEAKLNYKEICGRNLKVYREARRLTQVQMAIKLRVKERRYESWERGERLPDAISMYEISEVLKVTVNDLLSISFPQKIAA